MTEKNELDFKGILGRRDKIYYEEGREEGIEEGIIINMYQTAKDLINEGFDDETIKRISKLDLNEINKLKKKQYPK